MKPIFFGHNQLAGSGGPGSAFSDDFNRADSSTPGGNWTQVTGNCDISSNTLTGESGSYAHNLVRYNTEVGSLTQYQKATLSGWGSSAAYLTMIFRWGPANSSPAYGVTFRAQEDEVAWSRFSNASNGSSYSEITNSSLTVTGGDTMGVTIEGTGTGTVVRVWRNPSGLPSAANNWNGDTSPSVSFTTNPPTPVDTGLALGLALAPENSGGLYVDNWFGGSL